jgi:8-oxo-dGTP pyrophosphatase MutT (NUDIX family)
MIPSHEFFVALSKKLEEPLPGEAEQKRLSSYTNYTITELLAKNPNPKKSAVMIILWPESGSIRSLLIRRQEYEGVHSGQMAFPGGKFDPADDDLIGTAIRETLEEVGLEIDPDAVAGGLSPLYIPVSNFLVNPYVAFLENRPVFHPNPGEVEALVDFDVSHILNEENIKSKDRIFSNGIQRKTPYYEIGGSEVWGATAMIISELATVLRSIISS